MPAQVLPQTSSGRGFESPTARFSCSMAAFMIDIHKLFENYPEHREAMIIELMGKIAKSLLLASAEQQERSEHFLRGLIQLNPEHAQHYFRFSRFFVRFWNYGWKTPEFDQHFVTKFLSESKKAVDEYCISEETIYKSCGMPTRFRIAYSCAEQAVAQKIFSQATYQRLIINSPISFFNDTTNKYIMSTKETIFKQFDGGDRITFDRSPIKDPEEVLKEIAYILSTPSLPFFRYKFTQQKETPLTKFL